MNCFLLKASRNNGATYISEYAITNTIPEVNIVTYNEKIIVDTVREIRRALSFRLRENERKIVILNNEITIEAQNALLKCLEELSEHITIFIVSESHETILPTIASRCAVVSLYEKALPNEETLDIDGSPWKLLDSLEDKSDLVETQLLSICNRFRNTLLSSDSSEKEKAYAYESLKKILKHTPLVINNNVQLKIVLEKILLENSPLFAQNQ